MISAKWSQYWNSRFSRLRAVQNGELTQLLLDTLPPPEPKGLEKFTEGLGRVKPHLAPFPEKMSEEAVYEGPFPPPIPSAEIVCRVQNKLRSSFIQLGRTAKVVDDRHHEATVGLDQLFVTISSLTFEEAQAKFQEREKRSRASGGSESKMDLSSKTFGSRCEDEFELTGAGQLFRMRDGSLSELVDSCLVVGPAGTGKTLLLQRVVVSWAKGEVEELSGFEIVALMNARRDAEALKCDTPVEMLVGCVLQRQCMLRSAERKEVEKYMEKNSGGVLVLLDSADEGGEAWVKSKALEMLFQRRGLKECTFVATSRPCSLAYDLVPSCRQRFYLTGFNDQRLDELLVRRLGKAERVGCCREAERANTTACTSANERHSAGCKCCSRARSGRRGLFTEL